MADQELEHAEAIYQTRTAKAICVKADDNGEDIWLPRSLVASIYPENPDRGDTVEVYAPQWLLEREGLV